MSHINSILDQLSLREKIGQTCQIHSKDISHLNTSELSEYFAHSPVGSIFWGGEIIGSASDGVLKLQEKIAACQRISHLPLSISGDLENGAGGAIRGLTAFPNLLALGAVDDPAAAYAYGKWTAAEATRIGFNWCFGPVVDLAINWLNPIVSIRSLGQNSQRVETLAVALIRGMQDHGMSATAKHFPGDGVDFRDQHLCVAVNAMDQSQWWETFGKLYATCFDAGVHAVMAGHIALPWQEPSITTGSAPRPASTSARILDNLLRTQMGFEGVVVSDALIMAGFRGTSISRKDLIIEAFNAGIDVMLWPGDDYFDLMQHALEENRISETRLNESVQRILTMKSQQGLLNNVEQPSLPTDPKMVQPLAQAQTFAKDIAQRSLTVIANEKNLLPLDAQTVKRILIVLATTQETDAAQRMEPLTKSLQQRGISVDLHINGNCLDIHKKEQAGHQFDALLAIFELSTHGMKNTMRPVGALGECMWSIQGLQTMEPIVISLGSPFLHYDMPWMDTCINAYSSNAFTLRAIEHALFGEYPMNATSPVAAQGTWIISDGQLNQDHAIQKTNPINASILSQ